MTAASNEDGHTTNNNTIVIINQQPNSIKSNFVNILNISNDRFEFAGIK